MSRDGQITARISDMTLAGQQARYLELGRKVADMIVLTTDELAELILLREALQEVARTDPSKA